MENLQGPILILIIVLMSMSAPKVIAQNSPRLSLDLIGQTSDFYLAPAGQTTSMKLQILNDAPGDIYLILGQSYLDLNLNGTWELLHSEKLGNFHLNYLQSAVWTFGLAIPMQIRAANSTNGVPQVNLLIKITYQTASGMQSSDQSTFQLGVPGATLQKQNNTIWLVIFAVLVAAGFAVVFVIARRKRVH